MLDPLEVEEALEFGKGSISELRIDTEDDVPFDLPTAKYLLEALSGMQTAPIADENKEPSPNWRRLKRAVGKTAAQDVCASLHWIVLGSIFGVVSEEVRQAFRSGLSRSWFALMTELDQKGRDWVIDALPAVLGQAIYRLFIDAFPLDVSQLTKYSAEVLDKIGILISGEVCGFRATPQTVRNLRRKLFRGIVLEKPHHNLVEARRVELRQQKLVGKVACQPLTFGSVSGQPLEDMQMEHLLELRHEGKTSRNLSGTLPPLCPEELSADRHLDITLQGDELFRQQLQALDPKKAAAECGGGGADGQAGPASDLMESEPGSLPASPSGGGSPSAARRTRSAKGRARHRRDEAAEKKEREDFLSSRILAALPEPSQQRPLATCCNSPLLDLVAPGMQVQTKNANTVRMMTPSAQFLPRLATPSHETRPRLDPDSLPSGDPDAAARQHKLTKTLRKAAKAAVWAAAANPAEQKSLQASRSLPKINNTGQNTVQSPPVVGVVVEKPGLRIKPSTVKKRLDGQLEAFKKQSFEQYKRDYDIVTGAKRTRFHAGKLQREEEATIRKHYELLGSRSAPALRHLGPPGDPRRQAAAQSQSRAAPRQPLLSPMVGGKPWNELTTLDGPWLKQ